MRSCTSRHVSSKAPIYQIPHSKAICRTKGQRFLRRWLKTHPHHGRRGQRRALGSCWHSVNPVLPHLKDRGRNLSPTPGNLKSGKRTQLGSPRQPTSGSRSWVHATSTLYLRKQKGLAGYGLRGQGDITVRLESAHTPPLWADGVQDMLPQNTAPWQTEYFKLNEFEKHHIKRIFWPSSETGHKTFCETGPLYARKKGEILISKDRGMPQEIWMNRPRISPSLLPRAHTLFCPIAFFPLFSMLHQAQHYNPRV